MHRRAQSEERRRRVLKDDLSSADQSGHGGTDDSTRSAAAEYKESALQDQHRISDVIPRPTWAFFALFIWGASLIGGLLVAYDWLEPASNPRHAIFDLTWTGSLANWFAAFLLLLVSAVAVICYSLRCQKLTDYHGRYRVWMWTAALSLLASVAATTSWHVVAASELARVAPWSVSSGSLLWWLVPSVLVLGTISIRLILEMRASRAASLGMILALICYAIVVGIKLWQPTGIANATTVMMSSGSLLAGHFLLLISFSWYARYIILDMQGLVPRRQSKSMPTPSDQRHENKTSGRTDKAHQTPPPRRTDVDPEKPSQRTRKLVDDIEEDEELYEPQARRAQRKIRTRRRQDEADHEEVLEQPASLKKLTKAERKQLRKLKAQQREAA